MDVFTIEANKDIQATIIEEAYSFYKSVQIAREILASGRPMNQTEAYRMVSHLEPDVENEYKVDLDQFLSEKHKKMVERVSIDSDDDIQELTQQYIQAREEEKIAKESKQLFMQQIKQIMLHRGAQEIDFGEDGKIVWGKTFNVRYNQKDKVNF